MSNEEKLFKDKPEKKRLELARYFLIGRKINKALAFVSMLINSLFVVMFMSNANYGFILFLINVYIGFLLFIKYRKKKVKENE